MDFFFIQKNINIEYQKKNQMARDSNLYQNEIDFKLKKL